MFKGESIRLARLEFLEEEGPDETTSFSKRERQGAPAPKLALDVEVMSRMLRECKFKTVKEL